MASPVTSAQTVKKVVGSEKALPNGGSAAKFHKAIKGASGHHQASIATNTPSSGEEEWLAGSRQLAVGSEDSSERIRLATGH